MALKYKHLKKKNKKEFRKLAIAYLKRSVDVEPIGSIQLLHGVIAGGVSNVVDDLLKTHDNAISLLFASDIRSFLLLMAKKYGHENIDYEDFSMVIKQIGIDEGYL